MIDSRIIKIDDILDVEKHLDDIEAVIFDLDDTLYSEKDYVRSGYNAIADNFPEYPEMAFLLWKAFEDRKPAIDEVFNYLGIVDRKAEALQIYRFHKPNIKLYPGVNEMIERLKVEKKVGIITDGRPKGQHAKIDALGINVDHIIITDEIGGYEYRKPCPLAFQMMQQFMKTPFDRMVYVGDNIKKDFISPVALGMGCLYFANKSGLYFGK